MILPNEELPSGISVIVPCYRSEASLPELVKRLVAALRPLVERFEILLINDGSPDGTWSVIERLAREFPEVRGVDLMRNYGQHNALLCGIRLARFDTISTVDDDLQHPPENIPTLLAKLTEGYDVVYGPPEKMAHSMTRNFLSYSTKWVLQSSMGISGVVDINAFRVFRTKLRRAFEDFHGPNPMIDILLSWGTARFASIRVPHESRRQGESGYTFWKLLNQTMLLITGFSTGPLRFASMLGFAFTLFGIGIFLYVIIIRLLYGSLPGFPFLASLIALFSGAQLFALGILGEYLARMFNRTMERPGYVVRQTVDAQGRRQ